jgi:predicted porin
MMGKKVFVLLTVLVFLGVLTFPVWAEDDEETEFDVEIGVGYHITDYDDYPGKIGEYEVLDHDSTGPDFHFSGTAQNKDLTLDFSGRYYEDNDHEYQFSGDYRRILIQDFSYDRFQHWLDHDELDNLSAWTGHVVVSHEDFDAGKDYIIKRTEEKSDTVLNLPFLPGTQLNFNYRRQMREGERQSLAISHCGACHVTSQAREVDEETEDFKVGITKKHDWLTVSYNYFHREFDERGETPENAYDDPKHPGTGLQQFDNRVQYGDETLSYDLVPSTEKDSHIVKALARLPANTTLSASYVYSNVENNDEDLEIDSDTITARVTNNFFPGLNLTGKFRYLTIDNDDVYVDVTEDFRGAAPWKPGGFEPDFTRESAMSRDVTTLGFDARYQLLKRTSLRLGYEWEKIDRDDYAVDEGGETETETDTVKLVLNSRPHRKVKVRLGYKWQDIDDPFNNVNGACEDDSTTTGEFYWQRHDTRTADVSNQPTDVDEITADLTWSILHNLSLTANYRYTDKENDETNSSDWEQESHVPSLSLWYAPTPKLSFNLSYIYDWTETDTLSCIPVFDG